MAGQLAVGFDGGGVAAGGLAGVAGWRGPRGGGEEGAPGGVRGGRAPGDGEEARRGRGGESPDGGGRADDGAPHQGGPRRVPRLRVQAKGELEVRIRCFTVLPFVTLLVMERFHVVV